MNVCTSSVCYSEVKLSQQNARGEEQHSTLPTSLIIIARTRNVIVLLYSKSMQQ